MNQSSFWARAAQSPDNIAIIEDDRPFAGRAALEARATARALSLSRARAAARGAGEILLQPGVCPALPSGAADARGGGVLSDVGVGGSILDGLFRMDLSHGLNGPAREFRIDLYLDAIL